MRFITTITLLINRIILANAEEQLYKAFKSIFGDSIVVTNLGNNEASYRYHQFTRNAILNKLDYDNNNDDIYLVFTTNNSDELAIWCNAEMLYTRSGQTLYCNRPKRIVEKLFSLCSDKEISTVMKEPRDFALRKFGKCNILVAKVKIRNGKYSVTFVKCYDGYF